MEHVHAANHSWLVHEGEIGHGPRDATNLGVDLDEDLVDNGAQVLALCDGVAQHDLGGHSEFGQKESLDVIVEGILALGPRHEKHNSLHIGVQLGLELLDLLPHGVYLPLMCLLVDKHGRIKRRLRWLHDDLSDDLLPRGFAFTA